MATHLIDNFIRQLQPEEAESVNRYIKNNLRNPEESHIVYVYEKLRDGKPIDYKNPAALNKMKSRILEKSLDALLMDTNIINTLYADIDKTVITLKKQLVQYKMLQRNLNPAKHAVSLHLCNHIIVQAKKNELYSLVSEALLMKKYALFARSGVEGQKELNAEIEFYDYCAQALIRAADDYFFITHENNFAQLLSKEELDKKLDASILQMQSDFKRTKSQNINYYLQILLFAQAERRKSYNEGITLCRVLIANIKKYKFIYRKERMGFAYENLSLNYLHLGNYALAGKHLEKAQSFLLPGSFNYLISLECEFMIHFYSGQYKKAKRSMEKALQHPQNDAGNFRRSKHAYFMACVLFMEKEYEKAKELLVKRFDIEQDKERWKVSVRILGILTFIELRKFTQAAKALEALRKYIQRNRGNNRISARTVLIVQTLQQLERTGFEFRREDKVLQRQLKQLSARNTELSWEHYSPELIKFHDWLEKQKSIADKLKA